MDNIKLRKEMNINEGKITKFSYQANNPHFIRLYGWSILAKVQGRVYI